MGKEAKPERDREAQIDPEKLEERTEDKVGPPHSEINKRRGGDSREESKRPYIGGGGRRNSRSRGGGGGGGRNVLGEGGPGTLE